MVETLDRPATIMPSAQRTIERGKAASIVWAERRVIEPLDGAGGCAVARLGCRVVEVMRKIGAHHEQGTPVQHGTDNVSDFFRADVTNEERYKREVHECH